MVALGLDNHLITALPAHSVNCNFPKDVTRLHLAKESNRLRQWKVCKQFRIFLGDLCVDRLVTVVHDHAVWLPSNHTVAQFCKKNQIARVVSPRGMLGSWAMAHGGWKKRLAWALYQRADLMLASGFHATSDQEAEEIRKLGFTRPIVVVPNGIDVPETLPKRCCAAKQFLFMSRIHPKKGLMELLAAWKESDAGSMNWRLVIAGPDDGGYRAKIESEIDRLKLRSSVDLVGEIRGEAKWQLLANSDYFILPSHNENFGIAIAEALACGVPVITTTETPWSIIMEKKLGWWIPIDHAALVNSIKAAMLQSEPDFVTMKLRAKLAMQEQFSWKQAAEGLANFYRLMLT